MPKHTSSRRKTVKPKNPGEHQMTDESSPETITTAIHIKRGTWNLLRRVAFNRSMEKGGRASVSKLIESLVEQKRKELEREASDTSNR
jgi:hypothetical protein